MQMGTSDDLIGEIISNKIILSLMGSLGHKHGLAEKNHASRVGHFLPAMHPSIPAHGFSGSSHYPMSLTCFLLHNSLFPPHHLSLYLSVKYLCLQFCKINSDLNP